MKSNHRLLKLVVLALVVGMAAISVAMAAETTIIGVIAKNDQGRVIIAADDGEDYLVKGKDLSSMIGKTVTVTGTLTEKADAKTITVISLEEVED